MVKCRREKLEEIEGFDESMAYGEDENLGKRLDKLEGNRVRLDDVYEYAGLVSSLSEVFRQGRWYGKSMPQYFKKHPESFLTLLSIFFFITLPLTTVLFGLSEYFFYIAALQHLTVFAYVIIGLKRTRNPYMVFVPIIKIVRSYAEVLGMVEGLFTEDLGRE